MSKQTFQTRLSLLFVSLFVSCLSLAQSPPSDLCQEFTSGCTIQKRAIKGPLDAEDQYLLNITLGRLTEPQFNALKARYSASQMPAFDANRVYLIEDFLPAFIKTTNGKVLVPHSLPVAPELVKALQAQKIKTDKVAYVDANCHSVTWQWINFLQGHGFNEALFTLANGDSFSIETRVDNKDIRAGDVLLIQGTGGFDQADAVLHSAIYLGNGLLFEKPNPGKEYAFRFSYLKDVVAKYRNVDANVDFQFYRIQSNSKILPNLPEELSLVSTMNQQASSLDLSALPKNILSQYILQETWDHRQGQSVFTLGRILPASQVSPDKLLKVP